MSEIFNGKVILQVKGQDPMIFEDRTTREIIMILEEVQEKFRHNVKVEHFEIRKEVNILDVFN